MQSVRWYFERGAAFFLYSQAHNSADCKHGIIKAAGREARGRESRKEEEEEEDGAGNARAKEAPMK